MYKARFLTKAAAAETLDQGSMTFTATWTPMPKSTCRPDSNEALGLRTFSSRTCSTSAVNCRRAFSAAKKSAAINPAAPISAARSTRWSADRALSGSASGTNSSGNTYSMDHLGRYYADYVRMLRLIESAQPGCVHRVTYERLVEDVEGEVRRLLDYLCLPFDAACVNFHAN